MHTLDRLPLTLSLSLVLPVAVPDRPPVVSAERLVKEPQRTDSTRVHTFPLSPFFLHCSSAAFSSSFPPVPSYLRCSSKSSGFGGQFGAFTCYLSFHSPKAFNSQLSFSPHSARFVCGAFRLYICTPLLPFLYILISHISTFNHPGFLPRT